MRRFKNDEMQTKFGISLPNGKYKIYDKGDSYSVYTVKDDTEGCILVGSGTAPDRLFNSRAAFNALFQRLELAYAKGEEITIEVK